MLLYIIRHGDPDYATDSLTERGKLQAEAVGKRMSLTFVPNHLYRENGSISLDFDAAYTHPAIMASGMHEAVPRIARDGDAFLERLGYKAEGGNYRIL